MTAVSPGVIAGSGLFLILNAFSGAPEDYSENWWLMLLGASFVGVVVTSFALRMDLARKASE